MAGRFHRTYSRKKSAAPPLSHFDRLLTEAGKSTHPVASKTAGHIGKWGITSFTSLRNINGNFGKEDTLKRNHGSATNPSESSDPFSFESDKTDDKKAAATKRRKFFKSRESVPSPESSNKSPVEAQLPEDSVPIAVTSSIASTRDNRVQPRPAKEVKDAVKPGGGIRLKIFKSRNSDTYSSDTYSSTVHLPSDDSSNSSCSSNDNVESPLNDSQPVAASADSVSLSYDLPSKVAAVESLPSDSPKVNAPLPTSRETVNENSHSPSLPMADFEQNPEFGEITDTKSVISCETDDGIHCSSDRSVPSVSTLSSNLDNTANTRDNKKASLASQYCEPAYVDSDDVNKSKNPSAGYLSDSETALTVNKSDPPSPKTVNLFSTDFDEDEIIDRTSIEYSACAGTTDSIDNCLHNSDSIDLDEIIPANSSSSGNEILPKTNEEVPINVNNCSSSSVCKKKSIFKSRQKEGDTKKRATYKHKWHGHEEKESISSISKIEPLDRSSSAYNYDISAEDPFQSGTLPLLTRTHTWPSAAQDRDSILDDDTGIVTSVKCSKPAKKFYTVVKNVKKTHQLQESGEFQEFNDDVEYFLDALKNSNTVAMRCLASLNLAQKCMVPAFRMHLRAHATVTKFFRALLDAPSYQYLAECAAMVMFALSQDRLNMDLDRCSLELILNLLDTDCNTCEIKPQLPDGACLDQAAKIKTLCKELQLQGHAKHLKLDDINASTLAMETLLSLTSKRAGEWFKEELRELGGVDHLIRTVTSNARHLSMDCESWTVSLLEKLSKIDRCLKVLENVTHQNESNQEYLLTINKGSFAKTLMQLFWLCHRQIPLNPQKKMEDNPASQALIVMLITTIKVLINLTHGSRKEALGSQLLGKAEEIYTLTMNCLLVMPFHLNHDTKFEIQVLSCCLLLNLVEKSEANREKLMTLQIAGDEDSSLEIFDRGSSVRTAMAALVSLFYSSEESAREQEAHTDNIIEHDLDQDAREEEKKDEDIEEAVARLLQKAGRHMEDTLIAAYTSLLAGYCLLDSKDNEEEIRTMQPEGHFKTMVKVLKKFLHFMNLTATTSLLRSLKPTEQVIKYMESLDKKPEDEATEKKDKKDKDDSLAFDAFGF